jgi:hypothetical protein
MRNTTDWTDTVEPQLISAGFSIPVPFTGNLGGIDNCLGYNNLLELSWSQTVTTTDPIQILGHTGFSYFDGVDGGLFGRITATASVTVTLTMSVDYNLTSQQLNFFVAPGSTVVQASLISSTTNVLSGSLDIGDLAYVSATATAGVSFDGSFGLQATAADTDGKLRVADLTTSLSLDKAVDGLESIVHKRPADRAVPAAACRQVLTHRTAADFGVLRAMAGPIVRRVVFARQAPDGTPHSGASPPGSEPIGGLPSRVDCELMNQLNDIIGFAGLLVESDRLDVQHRRYTSHIAASGARACAILRAFFKEHRTGS